MNTLFDVEPVAGMVRHGGHETSIDAARVVQSCRTKLQGEILELLRQVDMTDRELERLERFRTYSPSTVRKRRSELYQSGLVVWTGDKREGLKVWRAKPGETK